MEQRLYQDPKIFLAEELARRSARNPRYSLRAFAKALGMTPSALSMILSGQRPLTERAAIKIAETLDLKPVAARQLIKACSLRKASPTKSTSSKQKTKNFLQLELDQYRLIAEWVHFAILSLITTNDFEPDHQWIARRLDISFGEAKAATERLIRLGYLDTTTTPWRQTVPTIRVENKISTAFTRRTHQGILKRALASLESDPVEVRDFSAATFAVDPKLIPWAREEITKFRRSLMAKLEELSEVPSEVYHLSVQIYPVTKVRT